MTIEVEPDTAIRAEHWDALVTRDIYTCLVVALRIQRVGTGFMGHFPTSEADALTPTEALVKRAVQEADHSRQVSAWPSGCAPLYDAAETAALRHDVVTLLKDHGVRVVRELWLPSDEYAINTARLDCPSARFTAPFVHMDNWKD